MQAVESRTKERARLRVGGGWARVALLVSTVTWVACGGAQDAGGAGGGSLADRALLRYLDLAARTPSAAPEEVVVERIAPPPGLDGWEVVAAAHTVTDSPPGLRMTGKVKEVLVPGNFDPRAFNVLRLVFSGPPGSVSVLARRGGRPFVESDEVSFSGAPGPRLVDIQLPRLGRGPEPFDQFLLRFEGGAGPTTLHEIVAVRRPLASLLPDSSAPGLVHVGRGREEARAAFALSTAAPLQCRVDVVEGMELAFCYALPDDFRRVDQQLELLVQARELSADLKRPGPLLQRHRFEPRLEQPAGWHEAALDLTSFAGAQVELSFELRASDESDGCCVVGEARVRVRGRDARTVLLVTSDTHRADHLGAARLGVAVDTPALDALAARGVLFEDCYSSTNVTQPSHTALLTGFSMRDHGVVNNAGRLGGGAATLAEAFHAAGFRTFAVVSVKHLDGDSGLGQGFDRLFAPGNTWDATDAVAHVEACLDTAVGEPAFVWLHLFDAHAPYGPPAPFDRCYYPEGRDPRDASLPEPEIADGCIPDAFEGIRDLEFPPAQYRAEVRYLDHELGRLLERDRLAHGIVALTADHGEVLERAGSYFNHAALCPATLHVPLVLAWPGGPRGERVTGPVQHLGLGRTLLDLAGLDGVPFPGASLVAGGEPARPRFALGAHGRSASMTHAGWHLVLHLADHRSRFPEEKKRHALELYRLAEDPECLVDVSLDERERARRMRELLVEWLADRADVQLEESRSVTAAEVRQLEALGYAAGSEGAADESGWIDTECACERCEGWR